jgi:hypothetical protein
MSVRSRLFLVAFAAGFVGVVSSACGNGGAKTPVTKGAADGGTKEGGASIFATSPPPSGLPAMATMPPPGVAGSKKAKTKADTTLATCGSAAVPSAKDPADHVKKIGEGCASASKMKPVGSVLRGNQADKEPHQENKFRAEANHCYRLYFSGDENVKDVVIVLRDSSGDVVSEAPGPAVPESGSTCFTAPDEVSVLIAIGSGKGAWAAQVWGD